MSENGMIIALAYPDSFVRTTEGRYNKVLERCGIVNHGLVRAGHSACLIVDRSSGLVRYADFGRYITPEFKGRARTLITDPDVRIEIKARFRSGILVNLSEILSYLTERPELTHGEGQLYAGLFYNVDVGKAWRLARKLSLAGSIDYGPFTLRGTNCSRFVRTLINEASEIGIVHRLFRAIRMPIPMPLDIIMLAGKNNRWVYRNGQLENVSLNQLGIWRKLFEKPGSRDIIHVERKSLYSGEGTWLENCGAGSWFHIEKVNEDQVLISRKDERGRTIFTYWYHKPYELRVEASYSFDYDTHAQLAHIIQNGRRFQLQRVLIANTIEDRFTQENAHQAFGLI